jgi:protein phosphatase methylesterase 1
MVNETVPVYIAGSEGHLFVCMHGAGNSAMTFAALAEKLKGTNTIAAFDWRGHGGHSREDESNMSTDTLIQDAIEVLNHIHQKFSNRSIIILGHAMGAALAAKTIGYIEQTMSGSDLQKSIQGLIMIDITEETATNALPFIQEAISNRPSEFPDLTSAIRFGFLGKQVQDRRSACVSIPGQLQQTEGKDGKSKYVWRTDMEATMPFWEQWFDGLNNCFSSL